MEDKTKVFSEIIFEYHPAEPDKLMGLVVIHEGEEISFVRKENFKHRDISHLFEKMLSRVVAYKEYLAGIKEHVDVLTLQKFRENLTKESYIIECMIEDILKTIKE
jgi:hypothetical protein